MVKTQNNQLCPDLGCCGSKHERSLFTLHHSPLDLGRCCSHLEIPCSELGTSSNLLQHPSSKGKRSPFFHHHSPLDLGRCCSHLEIPCSEGEASSSELGTPSNLLQYPSF
ncbi:hypothetical protein [Calothrix sp. NIES-2098]|uniref:hypothetical protein n=1 Tax=Calothrix sp. NIES-2098 TaxID=1954171 RepID=UPI0030D8193E